ncbi:DUF7856 family protein [Halomarina ordinaria]|uniref:Uncharacterized protein n=1 Tax=Halomarina ordinaria TaxID=3033939 RepID=A0ABD5UAM2_9EURY|nr:hypothetical protein [Halomarina sp. PSRA2]
MPGRDDVRVHLRGGTREGRALDLRDVALSVETVARAVRAPGSFVECPPPGPLHDHVGVVRPGTTLRVRTALAAAARSRGLDAPQDAERDRLARRAAAVEREAVAPDRTDATEVRRRLATASERVERLRERVATRRGEVRALREAGDEAAARAAADDLTDVARRLSERETEREAAREEWRALRERRRERYDACEERRRLADRVANLDRAARRHLVERVEGEYRAAVEALPGADPEDPFAVDGPTAALAVLRVGEARAPVVLACDRFASVEAAVAWLDAPALRL